MQTKATDKPTRGRPKKFIDLELVEKLAAIQCTYPEVASTLGVSVDTLLRHKDFAATFKRGAEGGRKSLRRMQFESANRGNVSMQIWLGKQYLGQSDHIVKEVRRITSIEDLSNEELEVLIASGAEYGVPTQGHKQSTLPPASNQTIDLKPTNKSATEAAELSSEPAKTTEDN